MKEAYFNRQTKSTNVRVIDFRKSLVHGGLGFLWRWVPGLTRWLVLNLFFAPGPYRINSQEAASLKQGRPFQAQVHDKTIQGWTWGHGPAVLLLHGWSGRGVQFHRFVAALVQAGYTAVAVDGPSHGASTGRITSYFEFTDTVRTLLSRKYNSGGIVGIIAHSFGAAAAINALDKERIKLRLVCIAPVLRLRELLFNTFDRYGVPKPLYSALIREFEIRFGYCLEWDNPDLLIGGLSGPVMIVHDEQDRTANFRDSLDKEQAHEHIRLYGTRGLGHRRILADRQVIHQSLKFLAGNGLMDENYRQHAHLTVNTNQ